ncbi:archease [Rhodocaloribacter sp.]
METPFPEWLREIDHTGDLGIEVEAPDLDTLYERAAWGMFALLTDLRTVAPRTSERVEVEADDREALMVWWLSELNYRHLTRRRLYCAFEVESRTDRRLVATVRGELFDPERHLLYTEIKAVTFHGLEIRRANGLWRVRIIFDM